MDHSITGDFTQFMCPVCLDLLKDPVTIPCGHSYCMGCIKGCWDQDDQKGVYSCSQCRQTFTPRPVLGKNAILAEVVEKLKTRLPAAAPPAYCDTGDVECGVCTGRKLKAIKSCLVCLDSYCQTHFDRHEELHSGRRHKIIDANGKLEEKICSLHEKLFEYFCRTDQQCVCLLCVMDNHRGHETVSDVIERMERQKELGESQRKTQQRIQEREKEVQELRQAVESLRRSAQAAVEDSERIFTELIRSIERRRREVTELIRDQEKSELSRAEGVLERLEQEISDLRRRDTELEQLSHTEDHIHFLQSFPPLYALSKSEVLPSITISLHLSFEDVGKSVSQLKKQMLDFCKEEFERLSSTVVYINLLPHCEPKTREEFLLYSRDLTLDPNTVNEFLCLSEGNKTVTWSDRVQSYPDHPERFNYFHQVLCRESVSARCYWETEWSGRHGVRVSVSYKDIRRKGQGYECVFGRNEQSWVFLCSPSSYSFWHNNKEFKLPTVPNSSRIGVYVDHRAGTLSFYSVSDTMTLLHRVQTTFTQPLYAGPVLGKNAMLAEMVEKLKKTRLQVSAAAERTEKQKELGETQRKTQQRIQEREKEVQELRQAVESLRRSAQAAVEDSERIFTELIRSIERRCREVTELIRDQEKSELSQAEGVLERLKQEICDLRRRDTELEQLSHTEDHIHFLQSFLSLCAPRSEDLPSITVSPHLSFEDAVKSVSQLKERLEDFCREEFERLSTQATNIKIFPPPEPKTREEFLQYSCDLTLDPNTAHKHLCLSEGNRVVTHSNTDQSYPYHPERFDVCQVLCRESVSERCYWEAEWSGDRGTDISVSYKDIGRKVGGNECWFGYNDQSWSLICSHSSYSFKHNKEETYLPIVPSSSRIGVYVDHRAGTLSFYSVSDTMTLLHRVHTTFTQPLYPGFYVWRGSKVKLCHHTE
ncbi:E3 ubiquitin/ISG15 ligase TRIM25-like [Chanos chanos]|uniref:E3 ubiquitin/ISG15 ligase TRIM25-like n=1 Tax=Chanos chanos TaxID=29144 RepID=A0A6J2VQN9_CHACN|nr:E3 ubiquitin/ISG15 ligase TRIM25-like [Chanos chanos]